MSTLELKHICKIYPNNEKKGHHKHNNLKTTDEGVLAVDDFNLKIKDKEFIVLVGPSGCGKSTTLRMVAGLEEISKGELYIDNKLMNDIEPKDRDIAMVFQSYALYPHMTVRQNMEFPLKLRKMPKEEIKKKVDEAAEILGITEYLDRKPKALSGGQRQRVAIGRAIVREPKVLLMDEPLSNLDAKLRNQMRAEIIKLRSRIDTTFIYVTHDQTEAMTLGDRIVIMKDGVVQQIGTPQQVYDTPVNLFVAGFIGVPMMNFFDGELIKDGVKYYVELNGVKIELSPEKEAKMAAKGVEAQKVTIGVRPEHMELTQREGQMIQATVDVSEMMGSHINVHIRVQEKEGVMIVDTQGNSNRNFRMGETIQFTFEPAVIHVFDASEITSFDKLKEVAEDITARKDELGFSAFTSAGMDGSSDWRFKTHLANLPIYYEYQADGVDNKDKLSGKYLDNYKAVWDLYINNSTIDPSQLSTATGDQSEAEFVDEKAVFYQNGTWEYDAVKAIGDENIAYLPIYFGVDDENEGICMGTENYWCVNSQASEADQKATLDFMHWCVTSDKGVEAMTSGDKMGFNIPFNKNPESTNVLFKLANANTATPVSWNFTTMPSENWKNDLGQALTVYAADQTDANWKNVVSAFVDNWKVEKEATTE